MKQFFKFLCWYIPVVLLVLWFSVGCDWRDEMENRANLKKECGLLREKVKEVGARELGTQTQLRIKECTKQGWWNDAEVQ